MKKKLKIENLGCLHCAMKMEEEIGKLNGVRSVVVNYIFKKMVIECDENSFEMIFEEAKKICSKIEPNCTLEK